MTEILEIQVDPMEQTARMTALMRMMIMVFLPVQGELQTRAGEHLVVTVHPVVPRTVSFCHC
jgi:hypothetical protein